MSTGWAVVRPHALEEAALHGLLVDLLLSVHGLGRHRHHPQVQVMADRLQVLGELLGKRRQGVEFVVGLLAEPLAQVGVPPAPWAATAAARAADRTNMTTGFFTVNLLSLGRRKCGGGRSRTESPQGPNTLGSASGSCGVGAHGVRPPGMTLGSA
jgi:hypothetical protein